MSQLKPYSSFTSASLAANFPAAKILFHADDYVAGATTWASRAGSLTLNLAAAATKDIYGVYTTVTNSVSSVTGTMPTLGTGYAVALSIGRMKSDSGTAGITATFGATGGANLGVTTVGFVNNAGGTVVTTPSLTGSITAGSLACRAAYFDLVDTTSPIVAVALASGLSTDQAIGTAGAAVTSDDTNEITFGAALTSGLTLTGANGPLGATNDGRRIKILALFEFSTALAATAALVDGGLQLAAVEMARTQELFAGWRNRASA